MSITWFYFGSPQFYLDHLAGPLAGWADPAAAAAIYQFATCLVLLGFVPALVVKLVFREKLSRYGVTLGNRFLTARSFLLLAPVVLLVAYVASRQPGMADLYPINRSAGRSPAAFAVHACTFLLLYVGWEFHFRGFVQHGLRDSVGRVQAVLIQAALSACLHLGKPPAETFGALVVGVLWGALALRTRSIVSGMLQHALLGIAMDYFICFA